MLEEGLDAPVRALDELAPLAAREEVRVQRANRHARRQVVPERAGAVRPSPGWVRNPVDPAPSPAAPVCRSRGGVDGPREAHHRVASEPRQRGVELGLGRRPADERDPLGALDRGQRRRVRIVGDRPAREAALQDREQHRRIGEGRVEQGRQRRGSDVDRAHVRPSGRRAGKRSDGLTVGSLLRGGTWDAKPSVASTGPFARPCQKSPVPRPRHGQYTPARPRAAHPFLARGQRGNTDVPLRSRFAILLGLLLVLGLAGPGVRRRPQRPLGRRREGQRRAPDRRLEVRRRRRPSMSPGIAANDATSRPDALRRDGANPAGRRPLPRPSAPIRASSPSSPTRACPCSTGRPTASPSTPTTTSSPTSPRSTCPRPGRRPPATRPSSSR